jgi:hypothetical protein
MDDQNQYPDQIIGAADLSAITQANANSAAQSRILIIGAVIFGLLLLLVIASR